MVVTVPTYREGNGARPVNLNKDIPALMDLLQTVFGEKMDGHSRRVFADAQYSPKPAFFWRLNPAVSRLSPGFVWEANGRIVGNVTLLATSSPRRYLVANVAVAPDHRRRGIAYGLMAAVEAEVSSRGGHEVLLQVVKDNEPAVKLYQNLNYESLGSITTWHTSISRLRDLPYQPEYGAHPPIKSLPRNRWREAFMLDKMSLHPDLNWPEPIPNDIYKQSWWQRFSNFMNGRFLETWVVINTEGQMVGLGRIWGEWGRPHLVALRVHPQWKGQIERPLFTKIIRRLRQLPRRNVRFDHPDNDELVNNLLSEANFTKKRTLTHMRRELE